MYTAAAVAVLAGLALQVSADLCSKVGAGSTLFAGDSDIEGKRFYIYIFFLKENTSLLPIYSMYTMRYLVRIDNPALLYFALRVC